METVVIDLSPRRAFTAEDLKPFEAPQMLLDICPEANLLWKQLFNKVDLELLFRYGFDDLMFRMGCQVQRERTRNQEPDYEKRARIWYHIAHASAKGKSEIPDLSESDINAWIPTTTKQKTHAVNCLTCGKRYQAGIDSKFASCKTCRGERLHAREIKKQTAATGELPDGYVRCEACKEPFPPKRADAKRCATRACLKQRAADKQKALRAKKRQALRAVMPILMPEDSDSTISESR